MVYARLPASGQTSQVTEYLLCAKLHNNTHSVPCLNEADCCTLLGNGWCITFENRDSGKLLHDALTKGKVILTGTKGTHQLYHLDTSHRLKEFSYSVTWWSGQLLYKSTLLLVSILKQKNSYTMSGLYVMYNWALP